MKPRSTNRRGRHVFHNSMSPTLLGRSAPINSTTTPVNAVTTKRRAGATRRRLHCKHGRSEQDVKGQGTCSLRLSFARVGLRVRSGTHGQAAEGHWRLFLQHMLMKERRRKRKNQHGRDTLLPRNRNDSRGDRILPDLLFASRQALLASGWPQANLGESPQARCAAAALLYTCSETHSRPVWSWRMSRNRAGALKPTIQDLQQSQEGGRNRVEWTATDKRASWKDRDKQPGKATATGTRTRG